MRKIPMFNSKLEKSILFIANVRYISIFCKQTSLLPCSYEKKDYRRKGFFQLRPLKERKHHCWWEPRIQAGRGAGGLEIADWVVKNTSHILDTCAVKHTSFIRFSFILPSLCLPPTPLPMSHIIHFPSSLYLPSLTPHYQFFMKW